jgi:hypothetical protein
VFDLQCQGLGSYSNRIRFGSTENEKHSASMALHISNVKHPSVPIQIIQVVTDHFSKSRIESDTNKDYHLRPCVNC